MGKTKGQPGIKQSYHIRAASPGLAMLSAVGSDGGDGGQSVVKPGTILPGYGKIVKIEQQGVTWVVHAENGDIRQ
jgi:hypothetical protein